MKARRIRVGLQLGRHIGKLSRDLQVVDDRSEVEAGAADEDRHRSSLSDAVDRVAGERLELADGEGVGRVDQIDEVVPDLGLLGCRGCGRADVHPAVDLHRVDRDELCLTTRRANAIDERKRERRLARGSRPEDRQRALPAGSPNIGHGATTGSATPTSSATEPSSWQVSRRRTSMSSSPYASRNGATTAGPKRSASATAARARSR